jgi:hypothetical protein
MNQASRLKAHLDKARATTLKPDPREIITFRGWKMTRYTATSLRVVEEILGYELTLVQGPYNDTVDASANTHDRDGVVDLAPFDAERKVKVMRANSWAIWIRPKNWDGRGGGKHEHGVLKAPWDVNELAEWQRDVAYPNGWDGLKGNNPDTFGFHPELTRFSYNDWWHDELLTTRITGINARIKTLRERISALKRRRELLKERRDD